MRLEESRRRRASASLKHKVGVGVSVCSLAFAVHAALAQEATADNGSDKLEEVIVSGLRNSLKNAQQVKKDADTVVDAITAEDIGALPDRSVNEALQRVPGVAISRFAAASDTQHFSVEGSGVVIRGLNYVQSQFNGRDTFAADGGRAIGFNDVAPEMIGSVEVYKNLTADMIEGGISGVINLNTRKPLDQAGHIAYLSAEANYGDFSKKTAPGITGVLANNWTLGSGARFGLLGGVTFSDLKTRSDSVFTTSFLPRPVNGGDTFPVPSGFSTVYTPLGGGMRTQNFDRRRLGVNVAAQFESADQRFVATATFLRSDSRELWDERTEEAAIWYQDVAMTIPEAGTDYTYNANGVFTSGNIRYKYGPQWDGAKWSSDGTPDPSVVNGVDTRYQLGGIPVRFANRGFLRHGATDDLSLNIKFNATDRFRTNFDLQHVGSQNSNVDVTLETYTWADMNLDMRGKVPNLTLLQGQYVDGTALAGGQWVTTGGRNVATEFANPNIPYMGDAMTNRADNNGGEWSFRADGEYDINGGFFRRARFGVRMTDKDETVRTNDYNNWGAVSQLWTAGGPQTYSTIDPSAYSLQGFNNFFRGLSAAPVPTLYLNQGNIALNYDYYQNLMRQMTAAGKGSYVPLEDRSCTLVHGYFCPNEVYRNTEQTSAGYFRVDFASPEGWKGIAFDGNIGVRLVGTTTRSYGSQKYPVLSSAIGQYATIADYCTAWAADPHNTGPTPTLCNIPASEQHAIEQYSDGASGPSDGANWYHHWLPSLNLRFKLSPTVNLRFAASKAIQRPEFNKIRNYLTQQFGVSASNTSFAGFTITSGSNPYLRPVSATQYDLTTEWYFSPVGSLTAALFYKELDDIILDYTNSYHTYVHNGVTQDVLLVAPSNATGRGRIKGFELAYQQTYEFLPGWLRGFGSQLSYTYVKPSNVPNSGVNAGNSPPVDVTAIQKSLPLAQLSKHNANAAVFYDNKLFSGRLAYSWRSEYLLTNQDCCFPFLPVQTDSTGQLDGSLFFNVTDFMKIGFEANNILDEITKTRYVMSAQGVTAPRGFFINDRRYALAVRMKF